MGRFEIVTSIYPDPEKQGCFTAFLPPILLRGICKLLTQDSSHTGNFRTYQEAEERLKKFPRKKGSYQAINGKHYVSDGGKIKEQEYFPDLF